MEYMGAFYGHAVAGKLIKNGMCSINSGEVISNVERVRAVDEAEEAEMQNWSQAVDGLLAMQSAPKSASKKCEIKKILDPMN